MNGRTTRARYLTRFPSETLAKKILKKFPAKVLFCLKSCYNDPSESFTGSYLKTRKVEYSIMLKTAQKPGTPANYSLQEVTEKHINMLYRKEPVSVTAKETAMILKVASHGKPGLEEKALPSRAVLCADRSDLRVVDSLIKMKNVLRNTKTDTDRVGFTEGIGEAVCKMVLKAKSLGTLPALPATSGTGPVKTTPPAKTPVKTSAPAQQEAAQPVKKKITIKRKAADTPALTVVQGGKDDEKQDSDSESGESSADTVPASVPENGISAKNDLPATKTVFVAKVTVAGDGFSTLSFSDFPTGSVEVKLSKDEQTLLRKVATGAKGQFDLNGVIWLEELIGQDQFKVLNGLCRKTLCYVRDFEGKYYYRLSALGQSAVLTLNPNEMTEAEVQAIYQGRGYDGGGNALKTAKVSEPESVSTVQGIGAKTPAKRANEQKTESAAAPAAQPEEKKKGGMVVKPESESEVLTILSENGGSVSKTDVPGRLNFAVIKLVKEGFVARNEGILSLTDTGKERAGMTSSEEQEADPFAEQTSDTPADDEAEESDVINPLAAEMNAVDASTATALTLGKTAQTELPLDQGEEPKKKIKIKKK